MLGPRISFAIPTYNFGSFLAETVHSIFCGSNYLNVSEIEVVIVDGASTDDTPYVVSELSAKYPKLRYLRRSQRGGIDHDMDLAVSMCSGDYVWLLSADDVLAPGWDDALLPTIVAHGPDVVLVPAIICTIDMRPLRRNKIFAASSDDDPQVYRFDNEQCMITYLSHALTLEALFSYMSSVVVRRSTWRALPERRDYFGSCWAHCARLIQLFDKNKGPTSVAYLNRFVLNKRTGNDSFMENGLIRRLAISVDGWSRILLDFFPEDTVRRLVSRLIVRDSSFLNFAYAVLGSRTRQEKQEVFRLGRIVYLNSDKSLSSKVQYFILRAIPRLPHVEKVLRKIIPQLARLRHRIKGFVSAI
jgi:abequosyltransferase